MIELTDAELLIIIRELEATLESSHIGNICTDISQCPVDHFETNCLEGILIFQSLLTKVRKQYGQS
jgi:hypothetical protein